MFKVNNKDTRTTRHWRRSDVFIVKFEYILHTFPCVSNDDFKHAFVSWERYNEIIILGSFYSQYKMSVNFIKLLCWNMITQLKESVSWFCLNTGKQGLEKARILSFFKQCSISYVMVVLGISLKYQPVDFSQKLYKICNKSTWFTIGALPKALTKFYAFQPRC